VMRQIGEDGIAPASSALVLAAHGTLLEPQKPIETGREATEQLCAGIQDHLSGRFGMIASGWLNHSRGGKWTDPPIEETLKRVKDAGYRDVVYYPYGFLADNAESQLEGKLAAAGQPALNVRFVPCLNGSSELADVIASQVASGQ
jgi:protoheme ferro-lyase